VCQNPRRPCRPVGRHGPARNSRLQRSAAPSSEATTKAVSARRTRAGLVRGERGLDGAAAERAAFAEEQARTVGGRVEGLRDGQAKGDWEQRRPGSRGRNPAAATAATAGTGNGLQQILQLPRSCLAVPILHACNHPASQGSRPQCSQLVVLQ